MGYRSVLKSGPVVLLAAGLFCFGSETSGASGGLQARKETLRTGAASGPLVLKRLLDPGREEDVHVVRDIFRPLAQAPAAEAGRSGLNAPTRPAEPVTPQLELTYLGFVRSGERLTAIVVFQGQTLTVAVDEEVAPGYKITRLTPDEIEIAGPDAAKKVFYRQGERS